MGIDGFTFVAQLINFAILVGLLRHFLYGPLIQAVGEREAQVSQRWSAAEQLQRESEARMEEAQARLRELDQIQLQRLSQIEVEVDTARSLALDKARQEVETLEARWIEARQREHQARTAEEALRFTQALVGTARKALAELADAPLERHMVAAFLRRLHQLPDQERERLLTALGSGRAQVVTSFELGPSEQAGLRSALEELAPVELSFATSPDLVAGVILRTTDYRLAWTFDGFLQELQAAMVDRLGQP